MLTSAVQQCDCYTHIYIYTHVYIFLFLFFSIWFITGCWIQFPVLYSRTFLFIHSICNSFHLFGFLILSFKILDTSLYQVFCKYIFPICGLPFHFLSNSFWRANVLIWMTFCCCCSVVADPLGPHGLQHTSLPCPSLFSGIYSNSYQLSWWCHPTISLCHPLHLLPSVFPSIRVFSKE